MLKKTCDQAAQVMGSTPVVAFTHAPRAKKPDQFE
jgi:hypothetical protein